MEIFWATVIVIVGCLLINLFVVGIEVKWGPINKLWDILVRPTDRKILTTKSSIVMKIFFLLTWPAAVIGPIVIGVIKWLTILLWRLI
ncbi:hypothetical protein KKG15_00925, partial [Patescibacteria group bacterium]|nr:hypothetical protein [Patescibacteria group bacterium]